MPVEPMPNSLNNNDTLDRTISPNSTGSQHDALVHQFNNSLTGTQSGAQSQQQQEAEPDLTVPEGQVTFDAEGNDDADSIYFSRKPHVPSDSSGVTLGRGYDMKEKSAEKIERDLISVGIDATTAEKISQASEKAGDEAKTFLEQEGLDDLTITQEQQKELFEIVYDELSADVQRICGKADTVKSYGEVDWENLDPKIKDILVDLRFRGDYTSNSRKLIQKHVADNDLQGFTEVLKDKDNWDRVPEDRFQRRIDYLDN